MMMMMMMIIIIIIIITAVATAVGGIVKLKTWVKVINESTKSHDPEELLNEFCKAN
jgi:hypothetical protein